MSWIFGAFGNLNGAITNKLRAVLLKENQRAVNSEFKEYLEESHNYWISAVGFQKNIHTGILKKSEFRRKTNQYEENDEDFHWFSVGLGIQFLEGIYKFMTKEDWESFLNDKSRDFQELNGHFCSVIVNNSELQIYTDQLGTREVFFKQKDDYLIFSTKLDLITKFDGSFEFDFKAMGSLWLLESQINSDCILKGINRLTSSGKIISRFNYPLEIEYSEKPWLPKKTDLVNEELIVSKLKELIYIPFNAGYKVSLALSGGVDSRMLLSILLGSSYDFDCFTFGQDKDSDVEIPRKMSEKIGFIHNIFFEDISINNEFFDGLTRFILDTRITFPASEYLLKRNYEFLDRNKIIIDGVWGEITRRSLFKRIITFASNEIRKRNSKTFFDYMLYPHSDIFIEDVNKQLIEGAVEHLDKMLGSMPDFDDFSLEGWLDLFAIRTKQPNLVGIEQARIDGIVMSYSPFEQPDFFNFIFSADPKIKLESKILKLIFSANDFKLDKYPLNAGGIEIPFSYSSTINVIRKKFYSFLKSPKVSYREILICYIFDYLKDLLNSIYFVSLDYLDRNKINRILIDYYKGNKRAELEIDWLLSFILFTNGLTDG